MRTLQSLPIRAILVRHKKLLEPIWKLLEVRIAFVIFSALLLILLNANVAVAHSPYFSQSQTLHSTDHSSLSIKLLHGDGIIAADPARAVIVDATGNVRAVSMMSQRLASIVVAPTTTVLAQFMTS